MSDNDYTLYVRAKIPLSHATEIISELEGSDCPYDVLENRCDCVVINILRSKVEYLKEVLGHLDYEPRITLNNFASFE